MICFRCGESNPPFTNVCNRCNAKLPKISINVAPPISSPRTARLNRILEIANKTLDGALNPQELISKIEKHEEDFKNGERNLLASMPKAKKKPPAPVIPKKKFPRGFVLEEEPEIDWDLELEKTINLEFKDQLNMGLKAIRLFLQCLNSIKTVLLEIDKVYPAMDEEETEDDLIERGLAGLADEESDKLFELSEGQEAVIIEVLETAKKANEFLNQFMDMAEEKGRKIREENILYEDESTLL
ncbi:MAG: hypothetical protein BWY64_01350 [bacterium ADurb.Bin363]|nr:MAG: hypothetical protein BWY64_01350 [bacterium ADurb.Bin363]